MYRIAEILTGSFCIVFFLFSYLRFNSIKRYDLWRNTESQECEITKTWPFEWKKVGETYELHLNYRTESKISSEYHILDQYVLQNGAQNRLLNFGDLIGIPDDLWKLPIDSRVSLLYPQAINVSDAINRLIDRKPLNVVCEFMLVLINVFLETNERPKISISFA